MSEFIGLLRNSLPDGFSLESLLACCPSEDWAADPQFAAIRALALSGKFDAQEYLARYPDIEKAGIDPIVHFIRHGIFESRSFKVQTGNKAVPLEQALQSHVTALKMTNKAGARTVSVIVTLWKRRAYVWEQYKSFMAQSVKPVEVIYIINEGYISPEFVRETTGQNVKIITSPINSLYTRFSLAYIARGDYVAIMDDDTLPGELWFENAIRACEAYNAYVVGNGRILNKKGRQGFFTLVTPAPGGDGVDAISCAHSDIFCDWGCNSYFLKREWAGMLAYRVRHQDSLKTFDDIQTATSLYMAKGIKCVCPMQPQWDKRLHASLKAEWGNDDHAVWRSSVSHFPERQSYLEQLIAEGYVPVHKRANLYHFIIIVPFADERMLERCLLTVTAQHYKNYICILVDDSPAGCGWGVLSERLCLDKTRFFYIRPAWRIYPLRSRELATDIARARLADVIVHLDGDDWFAHSHVLWQLNRIYRTGRIVASYGNLVAYGRHDVRNFYEFASYPMSKRYNMAQTAPDATVEPFRRISGNDLQAGWCSAPWSNMHTRAFLGSSWHMIDRGHFRKDNGDYLRVATDAAIFLPVLESAPPCAVTFMPDISYVYQNCSNTIHSAGEVTAQETAEARALVATFNQRGDLSRISLEIRGNAVPINTGGCEVLPDIPACRDATREKALSLSGSTILESRNAVATIITPDFLVEGLISLGSYARNLGLPCSQFCYVANRHSDNIRSISDILADTGVSALFPDDLVSQSGIGQHLEEKYGLNNDSYRWAMKGVVISELLDSGYDGVLFLDPDIYTVSDVTDVQQAILSHDISVFPHFRNPDVEDTRKVLYSDGFFNGGMLGATSAGILALKKLQSRCLREMAKDSGRALFDDQKYFDLFVFDVENLYINRDQGIDYNVWNEDPVDGMVAPSQRSYLLKSGYFARIWHLAHAYIVNAANRKTQLNIGMRFVVAVYLETKMLVALLLLIRLRAAGMLSYMKQLQLARRFDSYEAWLNGLSRHIRFHDIRELWDQAQWGGKADTERFLKKWAEICVNSICFDNIELFAQLLERFFKDNDRAKELAWWMRRHDLRYITEDVLANPEFKQNEIEARLEYLPAGEIIKKRINLLRASKIDY